MASQDSFIVLSKKIFLATPMAHLSQPKRCLSNHQNIPRSSFFFISLHRWCSAQRCGSSFAVISQPFIKPPRCNSPPTPAFTIFPPYGSAKMHDLPPTLTWAKSNDQCVN
ncbi:hypothetical protein I7I53_05241 [Histoplasma capsulatum var. duboisii H88]|uniref:Uncharacterized protein n=1 Tax=Ajellomyces capsulatus (strain H88) TaxID=544711 RepID=A0A8A1LS63_AJEC8|nr:hypothetical protein I7I53_05241 [Histoplasma capsulatum var. duboisii H88]